MFTMMIIISLTAAVLVSTCWDTRALWEARSDQPAARSQPPLQRRDS